MIQQVFPLLKNVLPGFEKRFLVTMNRKNVFVVGGRSVYLSPICFG